jgi:hypothetical protein
MPISPETLLMRDARANIGGKDARMKQDDSWKGEHLIRKSITKEESRKNLYEVRSSIAHVNRRALGAANAARGNHNFFLLKASVGAKGRRGEIE